MPKQKTYFEQIPLNLVLKALHIAQTHSVSCAVCGKPVDLQTCKVDEDGTAIHDACYFERVSRTKSAST